MFKNGALAAFVILALLPIACISTTDMMDSWLGVEESTLVAEWGKPDTIVPADPNGRIFIYTKMDSYSARGGNDSNVYGSGSIGSDIPGREMRWTRTYMFWLDEQNVVQKWDVQKEEIPYSTTDMKDLH
jgi:hypothetical protein